MHNTEQSEIEKFCSPFSMLVINSNGELLRLECPFRVIVVLTIDSLHKDSEATVAEVRMDKKLILVYVINQRGYYYFNFSIIL